MSKYLVLNKQALQNKQRGASMIVTFLLIAMVLLILIVAMKVVPAYSEHMNIVRVLKAMGEEPLSSMSKQEIKESFSKRSSINDITAVSKDDLDIAQNDSGKTVVSVEYQAVRPVMANVSVLIDFKASSAD